MDVGITELRSHLGAWLDRAMAGEEVVITDRGIPVARLIGVAHAPLLERLVEAGTIARPKVAARPTASGRRRPRATRPLSEVVSEQRR